MANIYFSTFILMFKTYLRCGHKFLLFFWITIVLTVWILENFVVKNLWDKVSKIKNLRWLFWRIFRWLCHSVLHFFYRHFFYGEICKTKCPLFKFSEKSKKCPHRAANFSSLKASTTFFFEPIIFVCLRGSIWNPEL